MKRILGLDPGSLKAGYALIGKNGRKFNYLESGTLKFSARINFLDRISSIYQQTKLLVEKLNPQEVVFESLVFVKNVSSLTKLSQARGAMIAACSNQAKLFEYSPTLVKRAVTTHGHSSKEGVSPLICILTRWVTVPVVAKQSTGTSSSRVFLAGE